MSRSKGSKASSSKLANKKFNRLAKQGKLKKKKKKREKEKPTQPEPVGFYSMSGQDDDSLIQTAQRRWGYFVPFLSDLLMKPWRTLGLISIPQTFRF